MDRQSVIRRIKALLAKTTENGCSEEEAMSAALKAREMMDRYQIDLGAAEMEADGFLLNEYSVQNPNFIQSYGKRLAYYIGRFCEVQPFISSGVVNYLGLRSDVEFASWLTETLDAFVNRKANEYLSEFNRVKVRGTKPRADTRIFDMFGDQPRERGRSDYDERHQRRSFAEGVVRGLNERLDQMSKEREKHRATGRGIVVSKPGLIKAEMARRGIVLGKARRSGGYCADGNAYDAGKSAADKATFGRPVNGGAGVRMIGAA